MTEIMIARTAFEIVAASFARQKEVKEKCFRIKNLLSAEVVALASAWKELAAARQLQEVRLVIADSLAGQVPAEFVAEPGRSITYYRNHNETGLVYLETQVQSDAQGLQNIFTLRDSNFLDGSFDGVAGAESTVARLILRTGWQLVAGRDEPAPALLADRVSQLATLLHSGVQPVPVRRFALFAGNVCAAWHDFDGTVDESTADRIIGEHLWHLDLFPDELWHSAGAEVRIRRRLELNARHADLNNGVADLDPETVRQAAMQARLLGTDGLPLPPSEADAYRDLCVRYGYSPSPELRRQIPYRIFEQLFSRDTKGLQLGDRVLAEIQAAAPSREGELIALDVVPGLNSRSQHDAERLLGSSPAEQGTRPLADLLAKKTRGLVERLASPPARKFFNPAIELARLYQRLSAQSDDAGIARMRIELSSSADRKNAAIPLFAFLFGNSLSAIADSLAGVPGACQVTLTDELAAQSPPPSLDEAAVDPLPDSEEDAPVVRWLPVPLKVAALDAEGNVIESVDPVEWDPRFLNHFALTWLLVADEASPLWNRLGALFVSEPAAAGEWIEPLVQRITSLATLLPAEPETLQGEDPLADEFLLARSEFRHEARAGGLSAELLNSYLDRWKLLLQRARQAYVPDGRRIGAMDALLSTDMLIMGSTGRRLMLPLHPVRLRWLSHYLQHSCDIAIATLSGEAEFGAGDGEQYLSWIESRSPHESPPVVTGHQGEMLFAKAELAWYGDFAPLHAGVAETVVDRRALGSIAARVSAYLEAHPYKRDGLAILFVLPSSDSLPAEFLERLGQGPWKDARISITVAAPKERWELIARNVELLHADDHTEQARRLFPPRDLAFIDYDRSDDLGPRLDEQAFDIAILTHVLHESVACQQNTEPPMDHPGEFHPLRDRPVWLDAGGDGGSISILMRPRDPDPVLESWGTLVVRADRTRPVAPAQPENVDFAELRVNFEDSARVFDALHRHSHWVITLERHISREQIESVEAGAPDVLSMEEGIGNNGLSTLIVSSRSGRELIESRLVRKLRNLATAGGAHHAPDATLEQLAACIYDETRHLAPHLALKAMGLSRVTEEILGLAVARAVAEEREPVPDVDGMSAWISLDDHAEWFGGVSSVRADMCRLTLARNAAGTLDVDILVLEGKLRQAYDSHGVAQVLRTAEFLAGILAPDDPGTPRKLDGVMWRERVLAAIESSARESRVQRPLAGGAPVTGPVPPDIRHAFRDGRFRLRSVSGIYSICLWNDLGSDLQVTQEEGVTVIRSTNVHILDLVQRPLAAPLRLQVLTGREEPPVTPESGGRIGIVPASTGTHSAHVPAAPQVATDGPLRPSEEASAPVPDLHSQTLPGRMSAHELRRMHEDILACFAAHSVQVTAAAREDEPAIEGPASILFKVRPAPGVDPRKLQEKGPALKLALGLEQEQSIAFGIDRGYVTVDVPKTPEQRYYVSAGDLWKDWMRPRGSLAAPIGEDRYGHPVEIDFSSSNSPHLLVGGTTGSGKSEALNTILFGLIRNYGPHELQLMLVDPKGTELAVFERCRHLRGTIGWDDSDAILLLKEAVDEMQRRYQLFREHGVRSLADFNERQEPEARLPWWLVVLDEYADLTHDPQQKKEIEQELKRLAQKARASGIHVVIATQKPSAEVISTNLRSNLPAQLALRVRSAVESRVILDEAGAETLNGKGDALFKSEGKIRRVQCARVGPEDQAEILIRASS